MTDIARTTLGLLDLTSLNDGDSDETIRALARSAATPFGAPAALCVHDRFLATARQSLDALGLTAVRLATVANFPTGDGRLDDVLAEIGAQAAMGADEVDVVLPWRALKAGDGAAAARLVARCRETLPPGKLLKIIIESGELADPRLITKASEIAIAGGADFVKTSTGKVAVNATLEAADLMLHAIRASGRKVGFKAAGGVRTVADAGSYLALAEAIMGTGWVSPQSFRFGASGLLGDITATLAGAAQSAEQGGY